MSTRIPDLKQILPQSGRVDWMGVRPARHQPVISVEAVECRIGGLVGDHHRIRAASKRQVTLIQAEHLPAIAALMHCERVDPAALRRNLCVSGINLLALMGRRFRVGTAVLFGVAPCDPCHRMESALGAGGFNAVCGHGGITAQVLQPGVVRLHDAVAALND